MNPEQRKLIELIKQSGTEFPGESQRDKRSQAEQIIAHVLDIKPVDIYLPGLSCTAERLETIRSLYSRRRLGEPLQYVIGKTRFGELELFVGQGVLIPRQETAELVDIIISRMKRGSSVVIDVGTGSGAIALSIAHANPRAEIVGVDVSEEALSYARKNKLHNKIDNACFIRNNLLDGFEKASVDIIAANLPYVAKEEFGSLEPGVKNFEPELALCGGEDGLDYIRKTISQSVDALKDEGMIFLEIGCNQGRAVHGLLNDSNCFTGIEIICDFNGLDRFAFGKKQRR